MAAYSGISARGGARDHLRAMGTEGRQMRCVKSSFSRQFCVGPVTALMALPVQIARADEGGVGLWRV